MLMFNPKLLSDAFPINKVEVFFDSEDHSNFLGFQWEMISQGKMPIGLNINDSDFNAIGKTGGEKEVTITLEQMPPHTHSIGVSSSSGNGEVALRASGYTGEIKTASKGGGQPHNNMPPYIVMAFWKRVA